MNMPVARHPMRGRAQAVSRQGSDTTLAFRLFIVLIVFTLLSVPSRFPILGIVRPTVLLVAVISVLIFMAARDAPTRDTSNTTRYLNILVLYMVLTIPFVQWPGSVLRFGLEGFIKAAVFFYFAVHLVDDIKRLRVFVFTILGCQAFRVLEPLYLHVTTGYWGGAAHMGGGEFMARLSGAPSDIINPNGLAFVVLTVIPFMHYLLGGSQSKVLKSLYVLLLPPLLYAFVLTGSRSGMIGILVVYGFILLRSKHKAVMVAGAAVAAVVMLGTMSADLEDRYRSIVDHSARNAETSEGRIEGVFRDFRVGMQRPLFGHGLGTSREALGNIAGVDQISHNLYTEVLIELGIVGLLLYLRVLMSIVTNVQSSTREMRLVDQSPDPSSRSPASSRMGFYQRCLEATLSLFVMCLIFSLASYGLSEFYWYLVAGLSVVLKNLVEKERSELRPAGKIK